MKKLVTLVLSLIFVLGFAPAAVGNEDPNVGFRFVNFVMSDHMLSPLDMPGWSGALSANKAIAEGQPVWFIAHYVQYPIWDYEGNFTNGETCKTVFTSKDDCVNFAFSDLYINLVWINKVEVRGGQITNRNAVSAEEDKLEVTMTAGGEGTNGEPTNAGIMNLEIATVPSTGTAADYYLQIMGFTKASEEACGIVYARTLTEFTSSTDALLFTAEKITAITTNPGSVLNIYNDYDFNIKYRVVCFQIDKPTALRLANLEAAAGDFIYGVYDADDKPIVGFLSNDKNYKGLVVATGTSHVPVQWSSDEGGKWVFMQGEQMGCEAISDAMLKAVVSFFDLPFGDGCPVLAGHFEAKAGYRLIKEAKYSIAAAVITDIDPAIDKVPRPGDAPSSMGLIMIAFALSALAAVGFIVTKRVRS